MVPVAESPQCNGTENVEILCLVVGKFLVLFALNPVSHTDIISWGTLGIITFNFLLDLDISRDMQGFGEEALHQGEIIPRVIQLPFDPQLGNYFLDLWDISFTTVRRCKGKTKSMVIDQGVVSTMTRDFVECNILFGFIPIFSRSHIKAVDSQDILVKSIEETMSIVTPVQVHILTLLEQGLGDVLS